MNNVRPGQAGREQAGIDGIDIIVVIEIAGDEGLGMSARGK